MIKITSVQAIAAALLACGLSAAPAVALSNRTWVSGSSIAADSGACTRAAPCKTFAFAFSVTNAGGEIDVLDPAGYGPVTITKTISIVNDGVGVATIGATSGSAITINAASTDSVHLRGLTILGLGTGANGILFNTGGNLEIENCVVRGFVGAGLNISPSTSSSFSVSNTIASNNSAGFGIFIQPSGSVVVAGVLSKVITNNNSSGILVGSLASGASLNVTIVDSDVSNNTITGVFAGSAAVGAATAVMLRNVVASNNFRGLDAGVNAVLRVGHSVVTGNSFGVNKSGGTLFSYGDNDINGNTSADNTGLLTVILPH